METDTFDIVIIGAGPSAAGILHALQQSPSLTLRVAVIERGGAVSNRQPLDQWCADAFHNPSLATGYTTPRNVRVAQGLGGGSLINAGLIIPPAVNDVREWNFSTVSEFRGALQKIQQALRPYLAPKSTCSRVRDQTLHTKCSTDNAFLEYDSVLSRVPLAIDAETNDRFSYVERLVNRGDDRIVVFRDWTALQVVKNENRVVIRNSQYEQRSLVALDDVILSCGTFETPALLCASGWKSSDDYTINDHIGVPRVYLTWPRLWTQGGVRCVGTFRCPTSDVVVQLVVHDSGTRAFCDLAPQMIAMVLPECCSTMVHRLLHILIHWTPLWWVVAHCVTVVNVFVMNPDPVGRLVPQGGPGRDNVKLKIRMSYPSENDIEKLLLAWEFCNRLLEIDGVEIFPVFCSKLFFRHFCMSYFHWMGTCKDLVDKNLNLVPGIRICDASVLPRTTAGPPALTCAAMGYALGQRLLLSHKQSLDTKSGKGDIRS